MENRNWPWAVATLTLLGGRAAANDLAGTYPITAGRLPDGQEYGGTVFLTPVGQNPTLEQCQKKPQPCQVSPPLYKLTWQTGAGAYDGLGMVFYPNVFASWGKGAGVVVYKLEATGNLTGLWALPSGRRELGTENATGGRPGDFGGTHQIRGADAAGTGYTGTLTITQVGNNYRLDWQVGNAQYSGVGVRAGDYLGAAWGGADVGVVNYYIHPDSFGGRWAMPGMPAAGMENLQRPTTVASAPQPAAQPAPAPQPSPQGFKHLTPEMARELPEDARYSVDDLLTACEEENYEIFRELLDRTGGWIKRGGAKITVQQLNEKARERGIAYAFDQPNEGPWGVHPVGRNKACVFRGSGYGKTWLVCLADPKDHNPGWGLSSLEQVDLGAP